MQKLRNIEFLRTYLIITIIFLHMFIDRSWCLCNLCPDIDLYSVLHRTFSHSNNSVEGFFIIAGFLLILTFKPGASVVDFIKKKYVRLAPVIVFSILFVILGDVFNVISFKPIPDILSILLLNNFGICFAVSDNPILWFTSALFAGLLLYFCLKKYLSKKYFNWVTGILFCLGYIGLQILQGGKYSHPLENYYGVFNIGFLRAVGGVGLGCVLGDFYQNNADKISKIQITKFSKIFVSLLEFISLTFLIWWTMFPHFYVNNIFFVLNFVVLFSFFVLKKGFLSQLFDRDIWLKLGRYQYSIFVLHYLIIKIFGVTLWKNNTEFVYSQPILPIIIMFILILAVGIFAYHFVEIPCANFLKNKFLVK